MYEKFTDGTRKAMRLANEHAQRTNYDYIEPPHLLMGLIAARSGAGSLLLHDAYDTRRMAEEMRNVHGTGQAPRERKRPLAPSAKQVVEDAVQEAREARQNYVGTEHLLLGLLRQKEGLAAQILERCGVTYADVRSHLVESLDPLGSLAPVDELTEVPSVTDPQQVDRLVRQAIGQCWQLLPASRRNADELATQIRRLTDRALRDFGEDADVFGA